MLSQTLLILACLFSGIFAFPTPNVTLSVSEAQTMESDALMRRVYFNPTATTCRFEVRRDLLISPWPPGETTYDEEMYISDNQNNRYVTFEGGTPWAGWRDLPLDGYRTLSVALTRKSDLCVGYVPAILCGNPRSYPGRTNLKLYSDFGSRRFCGRILQH